jgi:hypothetical protein
MSQFFNCPCPLPPIDRIYEAVRHFNQSETYLKRDATLHAFSSPHPGQNSGKVSLDE